MCGEKYSFVRTRKIRGVKKDENDAFIRLVDTFCGLIRDAYDGNVAARKILEAMKKIGIITEL